MADWSVPRKVRKSNFSTDEVDVLVDSVKAHYGILYGKYAKRATNRWIRQKAWLDILRKVNGVSIEKRTLQEVKNKWKKCQYALKEKVSRGALADDPGDSSWDDMGFVDSMPLQERLSKVAAQEKIAAGAAAAAGPLKSQPLSPTKLKVTRQSPKTARQVEPPPPSPVNEEMCLRWNSHHSNMQTAFPSILSKEQYVDVTLAAEGKTLKCHRLILSSCSPYFEEILSGISPFQHPVLFMRDIPFWILKSLCDFMYAGEVHIFQNKLEELLTVAEALKIKGLAGKSTPPENPEDRSNKNDNNSNSTNNNNNPNNKEKRRSHPSEKEKTQQHHHPPPLKKNPVFTHPQSNNFESTSHDYDDDLLDPLDLLEPLYEEAAEEKKPSSTIVKPKENKYQYQPMKKPFTRRLRKRKYSELKEPSPPPVFSFRKGTRSRPNVKIPKYYHSDYSNNPAKATSNSQGDPLLEVDEIKTEPIDVEDNLINYSDEDHYMENSLDPVNCDSPVIITSSKPLPQQEKFKKIKLTKPIITEVHTIDETDTSGGLEVIKITIPPTKSDKITNSDKKEEGEGHPLQGVTVTVEQNEIQTSVITVELDGKNSQPEEINEELNLEPECIVQIDEEEDNVQEKLDSEGLSEKINDEAQIEKSETVDNISMIEISPAETVDDVAAMDLSSAKTVDNISSIEISSAETVDEISRIEISATETVDEISAIEISATETVDENSAMDLSAAETVDDDSAIDLSSAKTVDNISAIVISATETVGETSEQQIEEETVDEIEEVAETNETLLQDIRIEDVRSTCLDEVDKLDQQTEEEIRATSLDHLEKEAMNVANAINLESQAGPPDIE